MPLHTDYRPEELDQVEGNENTKAMLEQWLEKDRDAQCHSLLFTGPSGCGKTSLMRIIARQLGALTDDGHDLDFKELNAADFRGIGMIRDIRNQMSLHPAAGDCRVWLLDEIHMLTSDAQEAFLKCLEEPPPHVYFLLATTNPEKLKTTLKRRCLTFEVQPLDDITMLAFLSDIVDEEAADLKRNLDMADGVLEQIALDSFGSPGVALSILDKIIGLSKETQQEVAQQTAQIQNQAIELCRALMKGKPSWKEISTILKGLKKEDVESIRRAVMGYCSAVILNSGNAQAFIVLDAFVEPFYNSGFPGLAHACWMVSH